MDRLLNINVLADCRLNLVRALDQRTAAIAEIESRMPTIRELTIHLAHCRTPRVRKQMSVSPPHCLGRMTNEGIDEPLVHAFTRQVADETVAQTMPAFNRMPSTATDSPAKYVVCFVRRQWLRVRS